MSREPDSDDYCTRAEETVMWAGNEDDIRVAYWDGDTQEIFIHGDVRPSETCAIDFPYLDDKLAKAVKALPKDSTLVFHMVETPSARPLHYQCVSIHIPDDDFDQIVLATLTDYSNRANGLNGWMPDPTDIEDISAFTYDLEYGSSSIHTIVGYEDVPEVYETINKYASEFSPVYAEQIRVAKALYDHTVQTWKAECEYMLSDEWGKDQDQPFQFLTIQTWTLNGVQV